MRQALCLGVRDPPQQSQRVAQLLPLGWAELELERLAEPALALRSLREQALEALRRELHESASAVIGIGAAGDVARRLEVVDGLSHRLRPHALGGGEIAGTRRTFAVEPREHRGLGD
jgi:hypothetical protein